MVQRWGDRRCPWEDRRCLWERCFHPGQATGRPSTPRASPGATLHHCPVHDAGSPAPRRAQLRSPRAAAALTDRLTACHRLNLAPALLATLINPTPCLSPQRELHPNWQLPPGCDAISPLGDEAELPGAGD